MALFRWFSKKPPAAAEFGGEPRLDSRDISLDEAIAAIAALRSQPAIQTAAPQFALRYGPEVIPELRGRFDVMIEPPPSFSAREPSVCAWASCWCIALFEILYQYREHALPVFGEMACNGHHGTAVVQLCRLAAEGVDRQQMVADLRSLMPNLPDSVRSDIAWQLLRLARNNLALAAVMEDLRQAPEFAQALVEVQPFGDECDGPVEDGPGQPNGPSRVGVVGRRALLGAIALALGGWAGAAVVASTGVGGAVLVGVSAAAFSAAVLLLVELAVLNRM